MTRVGTALVLLVSIKCILCLKHIKSTNNGLYKTYIRGAFITSSAASPYKSGRLRDSSLFDRLSAPSPVEPLPYQYGYDPCLSNRKFKYCGQHLDADICPTSNNVLIQKNKFHEYTDSGLYVGAKPNQEFIGRILAVGPGKVNSSTGQRIPMSVQVGEYVLFDPPMEEPVITLDDTQCVIVSEDQIYAKAVNKDFSKPTVLAAEIISPLQDRIFVRVIDSPNKTASGLVIARNPDEKESLLRAQVVAVGPGKYTKDGNLLPIGDIKVGDVILFSDTAADGGSFKCDKAEHAFVRKCAVVAKL